MNTLNYRLAEAADIAAIREVSMLSYGQFETMLEPEHWEKMKQNLSNLSALEALISTATTFVCEAGEELVGVVFLVYSGKEDPPYPADWASVRRLGVHPAYRGKGIARQLTQMCIEQATTKGEKILGLHTSTIMPDARHLYSDLGFSIVCELEPRLGQQYWLYRMDLPKSCPF
ncbi:MAG: GNAT family N-acetyltransferase [Chitinophaga sp.]|uniref:GNAT family N-acetyltransferase n=1 Tax=Chitinophaga sp. TaxID=1869181 RepID=UPI001B2BEC27|nr:GNAT family N-acetyltransferase [Chitinophaga sp.]MBO9731913.1 GNAT family N-acetyltransferase [Chitinophaga sp.]